MTQLKLGRPKGKDSKKSFTVSLRPSDKKVLDKKYGSLSKAIYSLLNNQNEKV